MQPDRELITGTLQEVFEQVAFMFPESPPDDEPFPAPDGPTVMARIEFSGPWRGVLSLAAPESVCAEIAANALGVDPDDREAGDIAHDALGELLNVCCGRLLTDMAGEEPVFDLALPSVSPFTIEQWAELLQNPECIRIVVEGRPVLARMTTA